MSTLYIRLPSRAAADLSAHWTTLPCSWAQAQGEAVAHEGVTPLADLAGRIAQAQRVVLLLAASDVTLLRVQVPPLSAARLKAALPNLLEDQLMSDPAESVFVAGPSADGLRSVAVVSRGWLEILARTVTAWGARNLTALPSQLCLPYESGVVSAAASAAPQVQDGEVDLTVRLSQWEGIGLPILPEHPAHAARDAIETLCAVVPVHPITLYVPQAQVRQYQDAAAELLALDQRVTVHAENWPRWIAATGQQPINLLSALANGGGQAFEWRPWRWPLALLGLVLLVNILALNIDWLRQKREADTLRTQMVQTYKNAFPRESVVVDPVAQMKQKIAAAQRNSGQPASDDLPVLAANFGAAWQVAAGGKPAQALLAGIDYRERSLFLRVKPGATLPVDALKLALAERSLSLTQSSANSWQIRSAK